MKLLHSLMVGGCLLWGVSAFGQKENDKSLPNDFIGFFSGEWTGEGKFASGKKISAKLSFRISLDSSWLVYQHDDIPPTTYKAISMWGIDRDSRFAAYSFDNFHGHRKFESSGWSQGKLILSHTDHWQGKKLVYEHFIYEMSSDRTFRMTYETSEDGIKWHMKDFLDFKKQ